MSLSSRNLLLTGCSNGWLFPKGTVHEMTSYRVQTKKTEPEAGNRVLQQSWTWQAMNQGRGPSGKGEGNRIRLEVELETRQGLSRKWSHSQSWRSPLLWCCWDRDRWPPPKLKMEFLHPWTGSGGRSQMRYYGCHQDPDTCFLGFRSLF